MIDDDWILNVEAYGWIGNEFRKLIPDINRPNFCSFLINNTYVYPDLLPNSNFPPLSSDMCPLPASTYWLSNYAIDSRNFPDLPFNCKKVKMIFSFQCADELEIKVAGTLVEDVWLDNLFNNIFEYVDYLIDYKENMNKLKLLILFSSNNNIVQI